MVPHCSVVTIQQCVEAWTFSDELRALRDAPAILAIYLLSDQKAVAPASGPNLSAQSQKGSSSAQDSTPHPRCSSFPQVDWSWHTPLLVPTFADMHSLDVHYTAYSIEAVGLHLGGQTSAGLGGRFCTVVRNDHHTWLLKDGAPARSCNMHCGHQRGARMFWCVRMSSSMAEVEVHDTSSMTERARHVQPLASSDSGDRCHDN